MRTKLPSNRYFLIFSDLDGTMLSALNYSLNESLEAVQFTLKNEMELIIVSSKTKAEIEAIQRNFGWNFSFIPENGGAIYIPKIKELKILPDGFINYRHYWKLEFGVNYQKLCSELDQIAKLLQIDILSFHDMNATQVTEITDLSLEQAILAKQREYDEPFLVSDYHQHKLSQLIQEINTRGLRYTRGGRLHHITGNYDKGRAVRIIIDLYRNLFNSIITIAIGDAVNDVPMFKHVDFPFLVRKPDNTYDIEAALSNVKITKCIGPKGFAEVIYSLKD